MKTILFIVLSLLLAGLVGVPGVSAETEGYVDSGQNTVTGQGVLGATYTSSSYGSAVNGYASGASGITFGGHFKSDSTTGIAVHGWAASSSGVSYGGVFRSDSTEGVGVRGESYETTGHTYGGLFTNTSNQGVAVYGEASADSGETVAGTFLNKSNEGTGVFGRATATTGTTFGGYFESGSESGTGVFGRAYTAGGESYGGHFESVGAAAVYGVALKKCRYGALFTATGKHPLATGVYGEGGFRGVHGHYSGDGTGYGVYGASDSEKGYGVYSAGNMGVAGDVTVNGGFKCTGRHLVGGNQMVKGNQTVMGEKSAVAKLKSGEGVTLYAVEAAENWFEDFGASKLTDGAAVVEIDPTYAETVNTEHDYHVFLTPRGECQGLYVANQKAGSFEVRELHGGKSAIPFSYRIVAKRKGYEDRRLVKVQKEMMTAMAAAEDPIPEATPLEVAARAE